MASAGGNLPAWMLTWMEGCSSRGAESFASRAWRMATNSSSVTPSLTWMFLLALFAHRRFPGEGVAAGSLKPVAIHPAAIKNYQGDIVAMRTALDDNEAAERPELVAPLRRLIHSVVVHAQPGVKGAFVVEIKGRLQELLGAPFMRRSVGGGPLVAGERLEPSTQTIRFWFCNTRYPAATGGTDCPFCSPQYPILRRAGNRPVPSDLRSVSNGVKIHCKEKTQKQREVAGQSSRATSDYKNVARNSFCS